MPAEQSIIVILPFPPNGLHPDSRLSRLNIEKTKKAYQRNCYCLTRAALGRGYQATKIVNIHLTFYPLTLGKSDGDKCEGIFKYGRFGVASALGIDDRYLRVTKSMGLAAKNCVVMRISK